MSKKEKRIEAQNELLARVYDLILNTETLDEERSILVKFKNAVELGKYFDDEVMTLAESLRQLSVRKLNEKKTLSKEVGKLYMDISTTGYLTKNLATGLTVLGTLRTY